MKTLKKRLTQCLLPILAGVVMGMGCGEDLKFSGECEHEIDEEVNEFKEGKWKIIKVQEVFKNPATFDYTCDFLVFNFSENEKLEVESDLNDNRALTTGEYNYSISEEPAFNIYENEFSMKIDNILYACEIKKGEMILDNTPLDGHIITLVKL